MARRKCLHASPLLCIPAPAAPAYSDHRNTTMRSISGPSDARRASGTLDVYLREVTRALGKRRRKEPTERGSQYSKACNHFPCHRKSFRKKIESGNMPPSLLLGKVRRGPEDRAGWVRCNPGSSGRGDCRIEGVHVWDMDRVRGDILTVSTSSAFLCNLI